MRSAVIPAGSILGAQLHTYHRHRSGARLQQLLAILAVHSTAHYSLFSLSLHLKDNVKLLSLQTVYALKCTESATRFWVAHVYGTTMIRSQVAVLARLFVLITAKSSESMISTVTSQCYSLLVHEHQRTASFRKYSLMNSSHCSSWMEERLRQWEGLHDGWLYREPSSGATSGESNGINVDKGGNRFFRAYGRRQHEY